MQEETSAALGQKIALRDRLVTARRRRSLVDVGVAADDLASQLMACAQVRRAATVAVYVSVGTEPGTGPLLEGLRAAGKRILLPVLEPDNDLDWATWEGGELVRAARGLLEPSGARLGRGAIATADVVLLPGLAADPSGRRLGRGGGSYDRALGRVPLGTFTCVLLYDDELLDEVPAEPHDRPVAAIARPCGITVSGWGRA